MREIKFQALDLGHPQKCWFESLNVFLDQWICYTEDEEEKGHFFYEHVSLKEYDKGLVDNFVFRQFTGLHDRNGKEIYEGDILQADHTHPMNVYIKEGHTQIYFYDRNEKVTELLFQREINEEDIEIIGNIYEGEETK